MFTLKSLFMCVFLCLFLSLPIQASSYEVEVDGMVCDFCARGLEKVFGKNEAVDNIDVSLAKGEVTVHVKEGQVISKEAIQKAIEGNGLTVKNIQENKGK